MRPNCVGVVRLKSPPRLEVIQDVGEREGEARADPAVLPHANVFTHVASRLKVGSPRILPQPPQLVSMPRTQRRNSARTLAGYVKLVQAVRIVGRDSAGTHHAIVAAPVAAVEFGGEHRVFGNARGRGGWRRFPEGLARRCSRTRNNSRRTASRSARRTDGRLPIRPQCPTMPFCDLYHGVV